MDKAKYRKNYNHNNYYNNSNSNYSNSNSNNNSSNSINSISNNSNGSIIGIGIGSENGKEELILDEYAIKHPLQSRWIWWYDRTVSGKTDQNNYGEALLKIYSFGTVEDFWCLWNNIKGANELHPGSNYHVFKEGIQPKWEDPANKYGGRWIIQLKVVQRNTELNKMWMYALLACIGNCFEDEDEVLGLVVCIRNSSDKICLWTRNAKDKEKSMRVGKQLKETLGLKIKIQYHAHEDSMAANASYKASYEI